MKNKLVIVLLPAFIMWSSCTERIEIETQEEFVRLVVEGSLSNEPMSHYVMLTTTANYFSGRPAPAVSGAEVTIADGKVIHQLKESTPGIYRTRSFIEAIPGHRYTLHITLAEPVGGHTEYTAESVSPSPVPLDSIRLKFHPTYSEIGMWEARGFFRDPPSTDFYRFMAFRNGELVTDYLTEWYITDDNLFGGRYVDGWTVAFLDQNLKHEALSPGDMLTVRLDRISREYAGFIQGVQSEIRGSYPLFTGPPANVKGNIDNGALGFFEVFASSWSSAIVP